MDEHIRNNKKNSDSMLGGFRIVFGIFMVIVYIGMGVLMLVDFFQFSWAWARYLLAVVFIVYGFWRGYRQFNPKFRE